MRVYGKHMCAVSACRVNETERSLYDLSTVKPRLLQPRLLQALGYCKVFGLRDFLPQLRNLIKFQQNNSCCTMYNPGTKNVEPSSGTN